MAETPNCPRGREEEYLSDIAGLTDNAPTTPWSRKEAYLAAIDGKMDNIEEDIENLKNNPDVVDVVNSYADLQAYDKTKLTDNDVIRVLNDETHDGESTYYRYSAATQTFTYIGTTKQYTNFVGTDGITAGEAGLVPAPATTDAGKFLKADGTWDTAGGGGVTELTSADYNYPTNNPSSVAMWLMPKGIYKAESGVTVRLGDVAQNKLTWYSGCIVVNGETSSGNHLKPIYAVGAGGQHASIAVNETNGAPADESFEFAPVTEGRIIDNLTTTDTNKALSANQGKVLNDKIEGRVIQNAGAPTTATVGTVGMLLEDTTNGKLYQCTAASGSTYTWEEVGSGGSSVTVVQTTGTSTTDVMSQDATTSMVFADAGTNKKIRIGNNATIGNNTVCIGGSDLGTTGGGSSNVSINGKIGSSVYSAISIGGLTNLSGGHDNIGMGGSYVMSPYAIGIGYASYATGDSSIGIGSQSNASAKGGVAIGAYSTANITGLIGVGTTNTSYGYNSSNYRLIRGVYDGQGLHDAATVGQALGETETYTIATGDWAALASSDPYDYSTTVTAAHTIGANTIVEILNDQAVLFGTYGFAVGSVSGQSVTIYSIGQPDASVTLKINYKG